MNPLFRTALISLTLAASAFAQIPHFLTPVSYPAPGASMVALGDVNGDGILDAVTANGFVFTGNGVSLLLGNANGTFQPARTLVSGGNPSYIVLGDFNHDGKMDIAVANEPDPNFPLDPPTIGGPAHNSVSLLLGNGDGTFQTPIVTSTLGALQMVAADFNRDGNLDLAVTTGESSPVQILLGNGNGTFNVLTTTVNGFSGGVVAADLNHDGIPDLFAGNKAEFGIITSAEMLGNGDGTFRLGPTPTGTGVLGDFNGDGISDLATPVPFGRPVQYAGETFFGAADGTWGQPVFSVFTSRGNLVAADFNGDGKLDLFGPGSLVPIPSGQLLGGLFLGQGNGTFTQAAAGFGWVGYTQGGSPFPTFAAASDLDHNGSPDVVIADGNEVLVALNTSGHPALLAQVTVNANFAIGGSAPLTGTVSLGGPAPVGGALVTLSSSDPSAFLPGGNSIRIPAGAQSATFSITTIAVNVSTPVTITAAYNSVTQHCSFTVVPAFTIASVSVAPTSLFGMFGGNPAVGTVTLSGPAADGVVVTLSSGNSAVLSLPASVSLAPGARTANFALSARFVTTDTPVTVSGAYQGTTRNAIVTVRKERASVIVTKAQYTVNKSQLNVEANSTDAVPSLQVYNPSTGALVGSMSSAGGGKYVRQFIVHGPFTSVAVQSSTGGVAIGSVQQK